VHEGELPRVIELEARHAFAIGQLGRRGELTQLPSIPIRAEEPDDALRLLERLDQSVQQDAVKAPVPESNAILMMLVRCSWSSSRFQHPEGYRRECLYERTRSARARRQLLLPVSDNHFCRRRAGE
jgi:hypothetical protein